MPTRPTISPPPGISPGSWRAAASSIRIRSGRRGAGDVTLTRLVLAWIPVTAWFVIATVGTAVLVGLPSRPPGAGGHWVGVPLPLLTWRLVEAGLLTMLGSLWFDSLGNGEWWLVFLLVGAIATTPTWLALPFADT